MSISITLEKTTNIIKYLVLLCWGVWVVLSIAILMGAGSEFSLVCLYVVYVLLGSIVLIYVRKDILSPPGIFTLFVFIGFGLNIPLIAAGVLSPDVRINDLTLTKVLTVLLSAKIAFIVGYLLRIHKAIPTRWIIRVKGSSREASLLLYILLASYVVVAALIRVNYHLGEAGVRPSLPFAGVVKYICYEGALTLCLWFLSQGLLKGRVYVLLGLSLLLGVAVTQALLGWRSGASQVLILILVLFWYQKRVYENQKVHSFMWLLLILISMSSVADLGNSVRVRRIGGDPKFVQENFVKKMLLRGQGTTRLAAVVDYFGPITFTNNFLIKELSSQGLTTTKYIDQKVYGVHKLQVASFGTSGPGGPYTGLGLLGVVISYGLLGGFCRSVYESAFFSNTNGVNSWGVVFYSLLIYCLANMVTENFGLLNVKTLIAVIAQIFACKFIFAKNLQKLQNMDKNFSALPKETPPR